MPPVKGDKIRIEDKLEIRRLYRTKELNQSEIAEKYSRSRERINVICNDKSLDGLENSIIEKENLALQESFIPRMIATKSKLLDRIDRLIDTETNIAKVTTALKEFNTNLQLLSGRPTEIKIEEKTLLDANKLYDQLKGDPDAISAYLLNERKAVDIVEVKTDE